MKSIYKNITTGMLTIAFSLSAYSVSNVILSSTPEREYSEDLCYTEFQVTADSPGNYHVSFWANPTRYASGNYLTMPVTINGAVVGYIEPETPGWQTISLSDNAVVTLSTGENMIRIIGDAYTAPMIEQVKFASTYSEAQISSEEYDIYHSGNELSTTAITLPGIIAPQDPIIPDGYTKMTIGYSFSQYLRLNKNQRLKAYSIGDNEHIIDLYPVACTIESGWEKEAVWQALNWMNKSEKYSLISDKHKASMNVKIPLYGAYRLKLRSAEDGVKQTVDSLIINVIDSVSNTVKSSYLYTDCDANYASLPVVIPADGNEYRTCLIYSSGMTTSPQPRLFIEGADSEPGRIVMANLTNLSYDSGNDTIQSAYTVKTSRLHIDNNNSSTASGTCYVKPMELVSSDGTESTPSIAMAKAKEKDTAGIATSIESDALTITPSILGKDETMTITAQKAIAKIEIYAINGEILFSREPKHNIAEVAISDTGIGTTGIYIVKIIQIDGKETVKKIVIQ